MKWRLELEFEGDRDHWDLDTDMVASVLGPTHRAAISVAEFVEGHLTSVRFARVEEELPAA